jgi:hypothetical protein
LAKRRRLPAVSAEVRERLRALLANFPDAVPEQRDDIREEVRRLADVLANIRGFSKARLSNLTDARSAEGRVLAYLKLFAGEVIDGRELQVVGGIQEVPRRIRKLRVEEGYDIVTGYTEQGLRPDQYILRNPEPNAEEARKWQTANRIRRSKASAQNKWLALLREYVGVPVSKEQMAYVAPGRDLRRVRELRTQLGWRVVTQLSGRPDLPSGHYVLESLQQLPPHDRKIPDRLYDEVLRRDENACRYCRWSETDRLSGRKKQLVELHHVEHHAQGGTNNSENLITLCNVDHDDVHRQRIHGEDFWRWLANGPANRAQ